MNQMLDATAHSASAALLLAVLALGVRWASSCRACALPRGCRPAHERRARRAALTDPTGLVYPADPVVLCGGVHGRADTPAMPAPRGTQHSCPHPPAAAPLGPPPHALSGGTA